MSGGDVTQSALLWVGKGLMPRMKSVTGSWIHLHVPQPDVADRERHRHRERVARVARPRRVERHRCLTQQQEAQFMYALKQNQSKTVTTDRRFGISFIVSNS